MKPTGFHHSPHSVSSRQPVRWILGCFLSLGDKVRASHQIGFILTLNGGPLTTWTILLPLQMCCRRRRRHSSYTFDWTLLLLHCSTAIGSVFCFPCCYWLPSSLSQSDGRASDQQFAMGGGAVLAVGSQCCRDNKLVIVPVYLK